MIIVAAPTVYNLVIDANADFNQSFQWTLPNGGLIDLTGFSAEIVLASDYFTNPNRTVYFTGHSTGMSPVITLTQPTIGLFNIDIPASETVMFTWTGGVYDLLLTSGSGAVTRLLQGPITISPGVTDT